MRVILAASLLASLWLVGCGGAEPEAEATWETHTTAPEDETAGGEQEPAQQEPER